MLAAPSCSQPFCSSGASSGSSNHQALGCLCGSGLDTVHFYSGLSFLTLGQSHLLTLCGFWLMSPSPRHETGELALLVSLSPNSPDVLGVWSLLLWSIGKPRPGQCQAQVDWTTFSYNDFPFLSLQNNLPVIFRNQESQSQRVSSSCPFLGCMGSWGKCVWAGCGRKGHAGFMAEATPPIT